MTTIAVDDHTHQVAKTLCKTLGLTLGELMQHGVLYFKKTGIDPSNEISENPYEAVKELEKRFGQLVNFLTTQQHEKLMPLLEQLIMLTDILEQSLKILPKSAQFEQVIKNVNNNSALLVDYHKKQMDFLRQSMQKISDENNQAITALAEAVKSQTAVQADLLTQNKEMQADINTKLTKKMFG